MRSVVAAVMLIAFAACGGRTDQAKLLRSASSWSATIELASHALQERTITPRYSAKLADAAEREVQKTLEQAERADVRTECERALAAARRLREASGRS